MVNYWRKDTTFANFSDTSNMLVKSTEMFLEAFQKKVCSKKNEFLSEYSILILSFIFKKSQLFSLFLTYNLIGVSYGHAFFTFFLTGAKIKALQTFQIPRTCS